MLTKLSSNVLRGHLIQNDEEEPKMKYVKTLRRLGNELSTTTTEGASNFGKYGVLYISKKESHTGRLWHGGQILSILFFLCMIIHRGKGLLASIACRDYYGRRWFDMGCHFVTVDRGDSKRKCKVVGNLFYMLRAWRGHHYTAEKVGKLDLGFRCWYWCWIHFGSQEQANFVFLCLSLSVCIYIKHWWFLSLLPILIGFSFLAS